MGLYRCICLCTALYLPMYSPYTDIPLYTLCAALLYIGCIAVFAYVHRYRACTPYIPLHSLYTAIYPVWACIPLNTAEIGVFAYIRAWAGIGLKYPYLGLYLGLILRYARLDRLRTGA